MRPFSDDVKNFLANIERRIYVVGCCRVQNDLMTSFLRKELGVHCHAIARLQDIPALDQSRTPVSRLLLLDCLGKDPETLLVELESVSTGIFSREFIVLFNVSPGLRIEEEAMIRGVRGFFYLHDPVVHFKKGVRAVFDGQLWISRELMTKFILERRRRPQGYFKVQANALSRREAQILAMLASGTKNEEIAATLYISPHTVKTHLYNIYKKIKVSNRLEAAFWAARNL